MEWEIVEVLSLPLVVFAAYPGVPSLPFFAFLSAETVTERHICIFL
jgi:hypothetical protein